MDERGDQNYKENNGATRPIGLNFKNRTKIYERAGRDARESPVTTVLMVIR